MNYSNTIVSGMLSWLRGIANWGINLFNLSGTNSLALLNWFSEHWVGLLITMIVIGLAIDWLVWIIRWRPYWVWFRTKRIMIDDTDLPKKRGRFGRTDDEWDGEEEDLRRKPRASRRSAEPDFFSVDPATAYETNSDSLYVDENSFRRKSRKAEDDFFSIAQDDPDALNFWQEDVFNTSDLEPKGRERSRSKRS